MPAICLALGSVILVAGLYLRSATLAEPPIERSNPKVPEHSVVAQTLSARIDTDSYDERPVTPEEKQAIEDAQRFFSANIPRLHQIFGDEYFQALAKRAKDAPMLDAVVQFGEEYRTRFREEHADMRERAMNMSAAARQKRRELRPMLSQVREVTFYDRALRATDAVADSTLGALASDILTNTNAFEALKEKLLKAEREIMHDEQMIARIDAIESGSELIALITEVAPRYAAEEERLLAQIPLDKEMQSYLSGIDYSDRVWGLTQLYKRSWSSKSDALSNEYQSLMLQMKALLEKVPSDRPERAPLVQQLYGVLAVMHKEEKEFAAQSSKP